MYTRNCFVAAALLASFSASAVDLQVVGPVWDPSSVPSLGYNTPFLVKYAGTAGAGRQAFGAFSGNYAPLPGGPSFEAFCVEIDVALPLRSTLTYTLYSGDDGFGVAKANNLAKLVTWSRGQFLPIPPNLNYFANAAKSAAFQAAVYEIIYDGGVNALNFDGGNLQALAGDQNNSAVRAALAEIDWAEIANTVPTYTVSRLSGTYQDMLIFAPVPEASTWAMMSLGVLGLGALARKRRVT